MEKNVNAINKIIAELSTRDYMAHWSKLTESKKNRIRTGKESFSYSLGFDTLEAIEIKNKYISGAISENDYKAYCLIYNKRTA